MKTKTSKALLLLSLLATIAFGILYIVMMINRGLRFAVVGLLCCCLLICISICIAAYFFTKSEVRRSLSSAGIMLRTYMSEEKEATEVFPDEYAEIAAQAAEIKADILKKEQLLKDENARKNDLITYLAHDLKTPLTSVIGYLCLLSEAPDMPTEQRIKYVNITLEKAKRLESLLGEFFDITRYNLQQVQLNMETIDLSYMLVQMTDEFYPLLKDHGNTIQLETDDDLTISGDPLKLARVFNNILKNAIAYSDPDTIIYVTAHTQGECVEINFINHGKTIPPEKLDKIFEKFFRLDEARSSNTGGAGLGLAIAKEIVSLHHGTITAQSHEEQTAFSVTLPAIKEISKTSRES